MNYVESPLKDIAEPHVHDVLCGRGGGTNNHIGNSHWRMLVAANKQLYITLPKRQKMLLSRSIVNAVRSQNPPGRFLQKDGKTKLWFDVGDQRAQEKTSQALREGAPDIRKKVLAANNRAAGNSNNSEASATAPAAPTSVDISKSGGKREGGETPQIPAHSSTASSVAPEQHQPESAASSAILPQTTGTGGGMIPPPDSEHYNAHHQQQQHQQQQQMSNMFVGNNAHGHMNLNERGAIIQNAMLNGARGLNGQHYLAMHNNQMDYQSSNAAYQFQHQQQDNFQQQMHQQQDYHQKYQYHQQQHNINYQQQQQRYQHQQQQQYHANKKNTMPTFDEYDTAPPEHLESEGLSFGSLHMTDAEMHRLQEGSSHGKSKHQTRRWHSNSKSSPNEKASSNNNKNDTDNNGSAAVPAAPMGGVLEPTGISIGDVSMHSVGTNYLMKLEDNGTSFGTMMSYNTMGSNNPDMVDGGLMDAVGTSFGSLSLDKSNRDMLFKTLEVAGGGPEVPPMFRSETKSSANLLDCSDTESESSREKEELTKQKSQAWEMMKTQLDKQTSRGASVDSHDLMPPPVGVPQNSNNTNSINDHKNASSTAAFDNLEIALPPTTMEANFSTLSTGSFGEEDYNDSPLAVKREFTRNSAGTNCNDDDSNDVAVPPPPPQLTKTDSF